MAPGHPPEVPFCQTTAGLVSHEAVSSRYYHLRVHCPEIAATARPGQFVMLACRPHGDPATDPLLPRPLALLDADPSAGTLDILYFVAGQGTELIRQAAARARAHGAPLRFTIFGPLGRGFEPVAGAEVHVGAGGGSGVAPLVYFFRRWPAGQPAGARHLILGARRQDQLARRDLVSIPEVTLHLATDDGSAGFAGNAVQCLEALAAGVAGAGRRVALYAAGPEAMLHGAAAAARARRWACRVSLEARMACGVGVCRGCVVDARTPHPKTGLRRRTVCQDGPVFDLDELAPPWGDG